MLLAEFLFHLSATDIYYHKPQTLQENNKIWQKIKGWYLSSLKIITRKIYLTQISKVAPAAEEKLLTETALTFEYLVLLPGVVTAL